MKKPLLVCLLGWSLLTTAGVADTSRARVGVVLDVKGSPTVVAPLQPPSRNTPVKLLASLRSWDTLVVPAGAQVTYSTLISGKRYALQGPCQVKVDKNGDAPSMPGVTLVGQAQSRAAIHENSSINLNKYGGAASRDVQHEYFIDRREFYFDVEGRVPGGFQIREVPGLKTATVAAVKVTDPDLKRERYVLRYPLQPATRYLVSERHAPGEKGTEFFVTRWGANDLQHIRVLEKAATDLPSRLELWEAYRRIRLFDKAEKLLSELSAAHPELSFDEQKTLLTQDRSTLAHP